MSIFLKAVSRTAIIIAVIVIIVVAGVAAYLLTAKPGKTTTTTPTTTPSPTPTTPKTTPTPTATTPKLEKEVVVVTAWGGVEYNNFLKALKEFEKKTGIKVKLVHQDRIRDYILTQLAPGAKPEFDVAVVPWPAFVVELASKGLLMDVTDIVEKVKGDLVSPYFAEAVKYNGRYYAVPIKMWIKGLWVNTEALKKAGLTLDDIKTLEGFKKACEALKKAGIQPLVSGAADKWPLSDIFEAFILRLGGPELHKAMTRDPEAWKKPEVKEAFKLIAELLEMGCWGDPKLAIGEKWEAQVPKLAEGKAAMYFMGNWITLFITNYAKEKGVDPSVYLSKIVYVLPPEIKPGVKPAVVGGGDWAIAPANPPHPNAAKKLLEWLASAEFQEIMVRQGGYLAVNAKVPKEAYTPADWSVVETIKKTGAEIVPDLDDNIVPSKLQQVIWNKLFELWANPDKWEQIYNDLVKIIESEMKK